MSTPPGRVGARVGACQNRCATGWDNRIRLGKDQWHGPLRLEPQRLMICLPSETLMEGLRTTGSKHRKILFTWPVSSSKGCLHGYLLVTLKFSWKTCFRLLSRLSALPASISLLTSSGQPNIVRRQLFSGRFNLTKFACFLCSNFRCTGLRGGGDSVSASEWTYLGSMTQESQT